jgi:alpha-ribazole phosphatase
MARLILIRHGQTEAHPDVCLGQTDVRLSAMGQGQMRLLRTNWRGLKPDFLVASDLSRASQSADILGRGWHLPLATDERLREVSFGRWEGMTWDDIEAKDAANLRPWFADWVKRAPPGGESFADLNRRTSEWLRDIQARHNERDLIAVVAHAGSIRSILCQALGVPLGYAFRIKVEFGRASLIKATQNQYEVSYLNSSVVPAG